LTNTCGDIPDERTLEAAVMQDNKEIIKFLKEWRLDIVRIKVVYIPPAVVLK
jgi:hypothetical protein